MRGLVNVGSTLLLMKLTEVWPIINLWQSSYDLKSIGLCQIFSSVQHFNGLVQQRECIEIHHQRVRLTWYRPVDLQRFPRPIFHRSANDYPALPLHSVSHRNHPNTVETGFEFSFHLSGGISIIHFLVNVHRISPCFSSVCTKKKQNKQGDTLLRVHKITTEENNLHSEKWKLESCFLCI